MQAFFDFTIDILAYICPVLWYLASSRTFLRTLATTQTFLWYLATIALFWRHAPILASIFVVIRSIALLWLDRLKFWEVFSRCQNSRYAHVIERVYQRLRIQHINRTKPLSCRKKNIGLNSNSQEIFLGYRWFDAVVIGYPTPPTTTSWIARAPRVLPFLGGLLGTYCVGYSENLYSRSEIRGQRGFTNKLGKLKWCCVFEYCLNA